MECTLGRCDRLQGLKYRDQAHLQAVPGFETCLGMVRYEYNLNLGWSSQQTVAHTGTA